MLKTGNHLYEFGPFRVDPSERILWRDDKPVPVTSKCFDVLLILLGRAGHLVSRAELRKAVWLNCFVEEGSLAVTISMLRKALGDEEHAYIKTVSGQGYRFVGEVRETVDPGAEVAPALREPVPPAVSTPMTTALPEPPPARRSAHLHPAFILFVVLCAVAAGGLILFSQHRPASSKPQIHSLLVLPFQGPNLDPARDYLRVGMAEALAADLAATGSLVVRPAAPSLDYANSLAEAAAIGRAQQVDAVLFGNIAVSAEQVRLNAQVARVADGSLLWSGSFEGAQDRMFDLEHEMENKVAQAIPVRVPGQEKMRSPGVMTQNPKAYRLYLEGRYFWNKRTEEGLRRSIESFQRATLEDQRYAAAYAGLADSYALLASYGVEPAQQAYPNARAAALKALQLDDRLPEAHTSLGMISFYYEWNWRQAEQEFRRSIELNPNYALAHTWYALELAALGRPAEALSQIQYASVLDPLSLSVNTEVGRIYYWNRQYDLANEAFQKVISLDFQFARAHTRLGMAYAAKKDFPAAIREFEQSEELSGPDPYLEGLTGYAQALSGNTARARQIMTDLTDRAKRHRFVPAFSLALVSIGLGDRSGALDWLDRAYQDRSTYMVYAKADPLLDAMRSDPRFDQLLRRMGLVTQ